MPGNPREILTMAERRFPARIKIGVLPSGFGQRYTEITEWLDGNCGADNAVGHARRAQRCRFDLFPRRYSGERLRRPLVRGIQG
jgi:hypothetical protein